jgi:DNA-binding CsgD family transcriptional regulator
MIAEHGADADIARVHMLLQGSDVAAQDQVVQASQTFFDAVCALRSGDTAAGREAAQRAAARFDAIGWPLYRAHALEKAGDAQSAVQIYHSIGATHELRRFALGPAAALPDTDGVCADRDGARALGRAGRRDSSSAAALDVLSSRERDIVLLIAGGRSNRTIAHDLNISEKTVERHLTAIFAKLGFRSRTQVAAYVASRVKTAV